MVVAQFIVGIAPSHWSAKAEIVMGPLGYGLTDVQHCGCGHLFGYRNWGVFWLGWYIGLRIRTEPVYCLCLDHGRIRAKEIEEEKQKELDGRAGKESIP